MQFKIFDLVLRGNKLVIFPAKLCGLKVRFQSLEPKKIYFLFVIFHLKIPNKQPYNS
jgi:hypothetical protein